MVVAREHQLYERIAKYLQQKYPNVVYRFDIAADLKLTQGQASKFKRLHPTRGYPDLFIPYIKFFIPTDDERHEYVNKYGRDGLSIMISEHVKAGLYLELKAEGNSPFKKDGSLKKDKHLEEQQAMLNTLRKCGYMAEFATGFDESKSLIDKYLSA